MGKYSSDEDRRRSRRDRDERRRRSRSRSRSQGRRRKEQRRRSRSRSREDRRRRSSRDRHDRRSSKHRRRHRSSSKSRRGRHHRSRSRSRSRSRRHRSRSSSRNRDRRKDRDRSPSSSSGSSSKSRSSSQEKDSGKDVKKDTMDSKDSSSYVPSIDALAKIESAGFASEAFVSHKSGKGENGDAALNSHEKSHDDAMFGTSGSHILKKSAGVKSIDIPVQSARKESGVMASLLHKQEDVKNHRWMKKLQTLREKKLLNT